MENPMANGTSNISRYEKQIKKTEIYKENLK